MVYPFICGTFHPEIDDDDQPSSPSSTPRKLSRTYNKNPYSTCGLDKFSALVSELEEKRQKIYSQIDPQEIVLVRFVYKNSDECVPVVVKSKDKKDEKSKIVDHLKEKHVTDSTVEKLRVDEQKETSKQTDKKMNKKKLTQILKLNRWRRPSYYLTGIIIFILLLLIVFGRSVTILCTCICWYMVPTLTEISNSRRVTKKKEYTRRLSMNKKPVAEGLSSPKSIKSPRAHGNRKIW